MSADPGTRDMIYAAISNAFYDARNAGRTMTQATEHATASVCDIVESVHLNAVGLGKVLGAVEVLTDVMLERTEEEEPFVANLLETYSERLEQIQANTP